MPFALADLKRSYGRAGSRDGAPDVRPYLLLGKDFDTQRERLAAAIEWYAAHEGKTREEVPDDQLAVLIGDYRLARCLTTCLQSAFAFRPPEGAGGAPPARLHTFDVVNDMADGYATSEQRGELLAAAAARMSLSADELEALLWCDAPQRERLTRLGETPTVTSLAALYNRRAVETLLVRALSADLFLSAPDGPLIRRLYLAVKRAGLVCELSLQDPDSGAAGGVWAHLFGPLELFGPRTRHGDRFARAVLELLRAFPYLEGSALVLVNEREYVLRLPRGLGEALREAPARTAPGGVENAEDDGVAVVRRPADDTKFDSSIERHLYQTLRGMERRGDTRSWTVQREPEPIVHGATVLVPDFALSRPGTRADDPVRVFVEVVGFWTPAYRERKRAKLLALGDSVDLVLVVQEELAGYFADVPFQLLPYKRRPSAHDLIVLLERAYPSTAPRRRVSTEGAPSAETARAEWNDVFAMASASPAAPGTPDAD